MQNHAEKVSRIISEKTLREIGVKRRGRWTAAGIN
jgi:hypothetical protein